jgi:hypothetical protein
MQFKDSCTSGDLMFFYLKTVYSTIDSAEIWFNLNIIIWILTLREFDVSKRYSSGTKLRKNHVN